MRLIFLVAFILAVALPVFAKPDLGTYSDIDGVRVYQDHQKKSVFYLSPSTPKVAIKQNLQPDTGFVLYRYLGRKGTGDTGKFWAKGILNISIDRDRKKGQLKQIKKTVSKQYGVRYPKLRSLPVSATRGRLIFADSNMQWERGSRWSGKTILLALDSAMSQVLWEAIEAGQTLVSVEMAETVDGVRKDEEGKWAPSNQVFSNTLEIVLDMKTYPEHFSRIDLGGRMVKGYTGLDVFCFDFLENLDEHLYSKVVEVAIPTPGGSPLIETVTFKKDGESRARIEFKLSKDLDTAYRVRITRVYDDGRSIQGPWVEKSGETLLDVTAYKNKEETP